MINSKSLRNGLNYIDTYMNKTISSKKVLLIMMSLAFIFILPILIAGVDYIDDSGRKASGAFRFATSGRFITEATNIFSSTNATYLVDIGPYLQILSIFVLGFAGWYFTKHLRADNTKRTIKDVIFGSAVVLNPFLLANISFRFDALGMITGYALAVVAAVLIMRRPQSIGLYIAVGIILTLAAASYQPMTMMFALLVLVLGVIDSYTTKNKLYIKKTIIAALILLVAFTSYFIIYKLTQSQVSQSYGLTSMVSFNSDGLDKALSNLKHASDMVFKYYALGSVNIGRLYGILGLLSISSIIFAAYKYKDKVRSKFVAVGYYIVALLVLPFIFIGPFIVLESPLTSIRTLSTSIGVFLLLLLPVYLLSRKQKLASVIMILPAIILLANINFSFAYGTALKNKRDYDTVVLNSVFNHIVNNKDTFEGNTVYFGGRLATPSSVERAVAVYPIMKRMYVGQPSDTWFVADSLRSYGMQNVPMNLYWRVCDDRSTQERVAENPIFELYKISSKEYLYWLDTPKDPYCGT